MHLFRQKKGQLAFEYLMQYGWAIIIGFLFIGTLYYYGALDLNNFLTEECILDLHIHCRDFGVSSTTVKLMLSNPLEKSIDILSLTAERC